MKKKRFIVEIEIPDNTGDLCWDQDETGLQAFHDCVVSVLPQVSLRDTCSVAKDELEGKANGQYKSFIERQCAVRNSFRVVKPANMKPAIDHLKCAKEDCDFAGMGGEGMEEVGLKIGTALTILESFDC